MIVVFGLIVLFAVVIVAVVGVATNTGSAHSVGDQFTVLGHPLAGLSTGQLFLDGIVVGVVGMLGMSMLLGTFNRRLASRGSRRALNGSRRESAGLRLDRERLTQQLDDERSARRHVAAGATAAAEATPQVPSATSDLATPVRSGLRHRFSRSADR